jgi:hypothetical protein
MFDMLHNFALVTSHLEFLLKYLECLEVRLFVVVYLTGKVCLTGTSKQISIVLYFYAYYIYIFI